MRRRGCKRRRERCHTRWKGCRNTYRGRRQRANNARCIQDGRVATIHIRGDGNALTTQGEPDTHHPHMHAHTHIHTHTHTHTHINPPPKHVDVTYIYIRGGGLEQPSRPAWHPAPRHTLTPIKTGRHQVERGTRSNKLY